MVGESRAERDFWYMVSWSRSVQLQVELRNRISVTLVRFIMNSLTILLTI